MSAIQDINTVVLIGSGKVATQMAMAFLDKNIRILQVYSYHLNHARVLADKIGCTATDDLHKINQEANLYIIAVKDDSIFILNEGPLRLGKKLVVHTSGSIPLMEIKDISENTGVFYPLQTFSKGREINWANLPLCIETSNKDIYPILENFAWKITSHVYSIDSETRRNMHLAAVFANNFTNYLLGLSKEILGNQLPFELLKPLVQETIDKAFELGPAESQTGPAIRGDLKTIKTHLQLLSGNTDAQELYVIVSDLIGKQSHK